MTGDRTPEAGKQRRGPVIAVPFPQPLSPVVLVRRVNRFAVQAFAPGSRRRLYLHLPNSGRMGELLRPGARGMAYLARPAGAKTDGTLLLVRHAGRWVGLDARLPNALFEACLRAARLEPFRDVVRWRREVPFGAGRVDFVLEGPAQVCLVETKSCNKVEDGTALFPDAPTARGARHLVELGRTVRAGRRAAIVWFVQRDDARSLRLDATVDPGFARAAGAAASRGVELYAYACAVTPAQVAVTRAIPVHVLPAPERVRSCRRGARAFGGAS